MELFMKKHFSGNMSSFQFYFLTSGVRVSRTISYLQSAFKKSNEHPCNPGMVVIKAEPCRKRKVETARVPVFGYFLFRIMKMMRRKLFIVKVLADPGNLLLQK